MGHSDVHLHWKPESITNILRDNAIRTRSELAERLGPRGVSRATVYRQFTDDWHGEATGPMMKALAREFRVALAQLVTEPVEAEELA